MSDNQNAPFEVGTFTAAQGYAKAFNTLEISHLEPLLADNVQYASQWVFEEIKCKKDFVRYLGGKYEALRKAGAITMASTSWAIICSTRVICPLTSSSFLMPLVMSEKLSLFSEA